MSSDKAKRALQTSLLLFVILCVSGFAQESASCLLNLTQGWKAYVLDFAPDAESLAILRGASENGRKLWVWRNGRFVSLTDTDTLGVGEGFYLNASGGKDALELSGKTGTEIELQRGWNLCSSSRILDGVLYWGLEMDNAAYVQNPVIVKNDAVWIYAATLTLNDIVEQVACGSTVTKTAGKKIGSTFNEWTVSGVSVPDVTSRAISFVMPFQDVFLKTNYDATNAYTLTVDGKAEQVNYGEDVSRTAPDKTGHIFDKWTVSGIDVEDTSAATISFSMPANDVTLSTNYTVNKYTLTVNGSTSRGAFGTTITLTAPSKSGYYFTYWTATGVTLSNANSQTISFTMPANDVTLSPNYMKSGGGTDGTYLVVNLSSGSYRYTETAPDLSNDTCRTTELWLRRIPKGTFTMGSPEDEVGRPSHSETQHRVTLSEDFYIGVFEMTQKQYELITGSRPSYFSNNNYYTTRPVEQVSYNDIRGSSTGAGWPSSHDVDSGSFLGKLRTRTGLSFDLPTEAQWEYACRAGTTTALNTGKNLTSTVQDSAMDVAGRYWYNGGSLYYNSSSNTTAGTAKVGSYLPNNWGLYDMHGNVAEWCLDWYEYIGSAAVTDPVGYPSGSYRVMRGSHWFSSALSCRSAWGFYDKPSSSDRTYGFRIAFVSSVQENSYVLTVDGVEESVTNGTVVSKIAPAKEGYTFIGWTVRGVRVANAAANPLSFTMPANDVTLTANHTVNNYKLTTDSIDEQVNYGALVSKTAPTREGYAFTGWTITGVAVADASANPLSFTMPANDVTLTANYSNSYKLTTADAEEQVDYGATVSKTAATKEGYTLHWVVTGLTGIDTSSNPLVFSMPANDVTLTANYTVNSYKLIVDGVEEQVNYGIAVSKTAPEKEGHTFQNWTVTGLTGVETFSNTLSFTMPANAVTLTANYTVNSYKWYDDITEVRKVAAATGRPVFIFCGKTNSSVCTTVWGSDYLKAETDFAAFLEKYQIIGYEIENNHLCVNLPDDLKKLENGVYEDSIFSSTNVKIAYYAPWMAFVKFDSDNASATTTISVDDDIEYLFGATGTSDYSTQTYANVTSWLKKIMASDEYKNVMRSGSSEDPEDPGVSGD